MESARCASTYHDPSRVTRREALIRFGASAYGLSLPALLAAQRPLQAAPRARSCILLFLNGGASQYETFDPRPDAPLDYRGTFKPIRTSVPGVEICEHLPRLARLAHRYSLVRSVTHTDAGHPSGVYWMVTGRRYPRAAGLASQLSRQDHPHLGSALSLVHPSARGVPTFVTLPEQMHAVGPVRAGQHAGFLGAAYDPMVVDGDPNQPGFSPGELTIREGLTEGRLLRRRALVHQANLRLGLEEEPGAGIGLPPHFARAFDMITGDRTGAAFDLSRETAATRDRYGRHVFGQSALIARRLVEAGVRLVAVNWVRHDNGAGGQGWDSHSNHLPWCKDELLPPTDAAVASLIEDLAERGLLGETLVYVTGEFGRTPAFNPNGGRDHWPRVFSALLAGGGIQGGRVLGASTPDGAEVARDPVAPGDLAATLFHCLGLPPAMEYHDPLQRPFALADGEVLEALL